LVGTLLGLGVRHTFFFLVVPIMAGGVGEGAVPLSISYADILHQQQGDLFAQVLPIVMLASLTAILVSGLLNLIGQRYPHLTGNGRLLSGGEDDLDPTHEEITGHVDVTHIAAAGIMAIALYLLGLVCKAVFGLPAPVAMLFLAVLLKLTSAVSPQLQAGSSVVYQFFRVAVTYPLLFAISVSATPWNRLMAAFTWPNLLTILATVLTLIASGFIVGRWVGLYPIDAAIVNACHSGQGGTGDVAILSASNRMQLMPFAQIATRIGGAITVTLAIITLAHFKGL
jgi:malate:Na+ symporter